MTVGLNAALAGLGGLARDEAGATSVEYALMAVIMAIMLIGIVPSIRDGLTPAFVAVTAALQEALGVV